MASEIVEQGLPMPLHYFPSGTRPSKVNAKKEVSWRRHKVLVNSAFDMLIILINCPVPHSDTDSNTVSQKFCPRMPWIGVSNPMNAVNLELLIQWIHLSLAIALCAESLFIAEIHNCRIPYLHNRKRSPLLQNCTIVLMKYCHELGLSIAYKYSTKSIAVPNYAFLQNILYE